ncbi:MAG: 3-keto-5-aminohexanoate cleavage protein [bacterium]
MQPLIVTAALVGAELTRRQQPHLPLTPEEIADSGVEAVRAGASILHLHVRDSDGKPTCDEKVFKRVIDLVRKEADPILQVSTGGAIGDSEDDRLRPLLAGSEMASLTTGTVNFGNDVFFNPLPFVEKLAKAEQERGIKPEIEVFDVAMLETGIRLMEKGFVSRPAHFQFVLGVPGALSATERNLRFLVDGLPEDATWTLSAIGRHQFSMMEFALKWGGHCRVGFEDNIYMEKGVLAKSNAELVAKAVLLAKRHGRVVATPSQAREILRLS